MFRIILLLLLLFCGGCLSIKIKKLEKNIVGTWIPDVSKQTGGNILMDNEYFRYRIIPPDTFVFKADYTLEWRTLFIPTDTTTYCDTCLFLEEQPPVKIYKWNSYVFDGSILESYNPSELAKKEAAIFSKLQRKKKLLCLEFRDHESRRFLMFIKIRKRKAQFLYGEWPDIDILCLNRIRDIQ